MGLIKWLNRHAFTSIFLYFVLMMGVAWAANEAINARTAATSIQDADMLAIYDDDAGAGRSITVSNFRGDNLNAIVNAETGVAEPQITMYDSSTAAGTADIYGTSTGSFYVVMSLGVEDSSSATGTDYIQLNGTTEKVNVLKPLTAPSIDAGMISYGSSSTSIDLDTSYSTNCRMLLIASAAGERTWTLPDDELCGYGTGSTVKELMFINNDTDSELIIDTGEETDIIEVYGTDQTDSCSAGEVLYVDFRGAIKFYGRVDGYWFAVPQGETDVNCGSTNNP